MSAPLARFDGLPEGLCRCSARQLADRLGSPSLIHLRGRREPPLFISVLLHGNETSGWNGLRRLLLEPPPLPRSLLIFIGNVDAAAAGVRTLPHQQDYNRIWRGARGPEAALATEVLTTLRSHGCFAAVDLHNNTGHNPHYAVLTDLTAANLGLAYLFDDKAVYVRQPDTVLTRALAGCCPAVTLELGPIGDARCDDRAFDYLQRCLRLEAVPRADPERMQLFRTEARVHVREGVSFSFAGHDESATLVLTGGMEAVNFHELTAGTEFAVTRRGADAPLQVLDTGQHDVTDRFFTRCGERLVLARSVIPAMYTTDALVVRQDCLCYFMAKMTPPAP